MDVLPSLAPPLLLWAALRDLLYRKVDNRLIVVLAAVWLAIVPAEIFPGGRFSQGAAQQVGHTLVGAGAVLVIGFVLFLRGYVGAGDVKLTAALCLWVGAPLQMPFILATSLFGGVLIVAMPLVSRIEIALAMAWASWSSRIPILGGLPPPSCLAGPPIPGLPYAIAIALGALATLNAM